MVDERPVTLEMLGDVLTDHDLARLMRRSLRWPQDERCRARRARRVPDLPVAMRGVARPRYRKADVIAWMATGTKRRAS